MLFLSFFMASLIGAAFSITCPYPFLGSNNGYSFNNCYLYLGPSARQTDAHNKCLAYKAGLVTPKNSAGLADLYQLYKGFSDFYFWLGATAAPSNPYLFRWQDGQQVDSSAWCSGHPKGGDNLCTFYTTTAIIGRDKCIKSGPCSGNVFDHGTICHLNGANINFGGSSTTPAMSYACPCSFCTHLSYYDNACSACCAAMVGK